MRERLRLLEPGGVTDGHDTRYLRGVEALPGALAAAAVPEFIPRLIQKFISRGSFPGKAASPCLRSSECPKTA
jgi:hypothetical protein